MAKRQLGQFYTTNYKYIMDGLSIPSDVSCIIEPFVGRGDLLNFVRDNPKYVFELYDIDPMCSGTIERDTLLNPPDYTDKFVLTNPPYLARNKSKSKDIYNKWGLNDLYKCFIKTILIQPAIGGIIIIPLNFLSSIRVSDIKLRRLFVDVYQIDRVNVFEERVFKDTSYTVCCIQFHKKTSRTNNDFPVNFYPSKTLLNIGLNKSNNYTIGGGLYLLDSVHPSSLHMVDRLTKYTKKTNCITNILVKCIDDSDTNQLGLSIVEDSDQFIDNTPNLTARSYATLVISPSLLLSQQVNLVERFNRFMVENRLKYRSLFLTNYRESKDGMSRKRVSFSFVYSLVRHLLAEPALFSVLDTRVKTPVNPLQT